MPPGPKLTILTDDSGADGRVFRCPVAGCTYASAKRRYVGDHMRTHEKRDPNAKRFGCPYPGCTYSCTRVRYIGEHMRRHTGIKPHKCEHPGCTFTAGLDEGVPALSLPNLVYMENPYSHKKYQ
jgi:hypothetical protein